MSPPPFHRLPPALESAVQRLKLSAREATERTIESLGLAALAVGTAHQRDGLLGAQFELNRKSAMFALAFNEAFDERVRRELGAAPAPASGPAASSWDALSLVDDQEIEARIAAERFGLAVAHACEWELRELDGYIASVLGRSHGSAQTPGQAPERNPLRPEVVGHALLRGIDAVSDRSEIRKALVAELGRSLAALLGPAYAAIVADLRDAGVRPLGLGVRQTPSAAASADTTRRGPLDDGDTAASVHGLGSDRLPPSVHGAEGRVSTRGGGAPMPQAAGARADAPASGPGGLGSLGQIDPGLMNLIRRLAYTELGEIDARAPALRGGDGGGGGGSGGGVSMAGELPNLIVAHREALRQASGGKLDHMVIDVIGSLFEQILADPKVPPQMARQIARLQLPVLRAALGDPSFFSSRRHPVRRFVNRIASLGAAFDDVDEPVARRVLQKVRELVQAVVEGDFDQIATYEQTLAELEAFVAAQLQAATPAGDEPAALLAAKEDQLRLRQLYAERLHGELQSLAAPEFLRDFISRTWSQVLLQAAAAGDGGALLQRMRLAGRELFISVQPKPTPALRKVFLAELPRLMQDLTRGMDLIGWPDAERRAFFGQLMPAHAEALKAPGGRALDINLMAAQVGQLLERPPPSAQEVAAQRRQLPVLTDAISGPLFDAAEAGRVGLVEESAVDWSRPAVAPAAEAQTGDGSGVAAAPGPALGAGAAEAGEPPPLPGVPEMAGPPEPVAGAALADSVQIGCAYRMHLDEGWQKVRLAHVSEGRGFFVFTRGGRHPRTLSLTRRMLQRMCESGRLLAFEESYLLERATLRARRQLAAVGAVGAAARPR